MTETKKQDAAIVKADAGAVYIGEAETLAIAAPHGLLALDQINLLSHKTPQKYIKKRKGRGGKEFSYVEVNYVTGILNAIFAFEWDFEVVDRIINEKEKQIAVLGRLSVRMADGRTIKKEAWGGSDIKMLVGGNGMVDFADDLKAASSDSLKKCASMLGIAWDVYSGLSGKEDERYGEAPPRPTAQRPNPKPEQAVTVPPKNADIGDDENAWPPEDAGSAEDDKDKFRTIDLTLSDGKQVKVSKFEALALFKKIREKGLGDENYYRVLTSFKFNHANEIPPARIPEVYAVMVEAWKTVQKGKNLFGGK